MPPVPAVADFEKLGLFYLGRTYDLKAKAPKDELVLYDAADLVTHAVCVGMTGSGKTGLCLTLLEEAAIDHIPAIVVDPKGDLADLLLTFPDLKPADFEPWVNADDAKKRGQTPAEFAAAQAALWKKGLAEWGQDGSRVRAFRDSAEVVVYTPGSTAGLPVSVLKSFAAPDAATRGDAEALKERVTAAATALLTLVGMDADPVQDREHILLGTILQTAWKAGNDLDLAAIIQQIQSPPVKRIGVVDMDSFYPAKDRFALAMKINNLLASPGFEVWLEGDALDVGALLHTPAGKPRVAIFSIAHLNDAERMFFVTQLLNATLAWMRAQSGTTSLRALFYMDEIFGYFPPTKNPPTKQPLLTMLKQGRAFGLGVVLATQNPVDLDYKGLSNCGTWFIGRLQTDRDKMRVLDGLEGAAATAASKFDRGAMEQTIAGLGNRIFLLHNVHEDAPVVFQVRWALSYLRGPLTKPQIKALMDPVKAERQAAAQPATVAGKPAAEAPKAEPAPPGAAGPRPLLPPEVAQYFLPARAAGPDDSSLVYVPAVLGCGTAAVSDAKLGVSETQEFAWLAPITDDAVGVDWAYSNEVSVTPADLHKDPAEGTFDPVPAVAAKAKSYDAWKKSFVDAVLRYQKLTLFKSPSTEEVSRPGEAEKDFRVRLQHAAHEERDRQVEKLRQKYAPKIAALQERARKAAQAVERERGKSRQSKLSSVLSVGSTVFGIFTKRRRSISATDIGKATTAAKGFGRSIKDAGDVARAKETEEALKQQLADLEEQLKAEIDEVAARTDPTTEELETIEVKAKKSGVGVVLVALGWAPYWRSPDGTATPAW
jgi:hypothetical protein